MATKSGLISAINTFITATITQLKHRNSMLELVNELFQTTTTQSETGSSDVFGHVLRYKKQGNIVNISGYIVNKYSVAKSNQDIVTIPNSVYYAKTGEPTTFFGFTETTGTPVEIQFTTDTIFLVGSLADSQKIWINLHYQTND